MNKINFLECAPQLKSIIKQYNICTIETYMQIISKLMSCLSELRKTMKQIKYTKSVKFITPYFTVITHTAGLQGLRKSKPFSEEIGLS